MKSRRQFQNREAGQTIVLVAISIFSLLAMATLAIDVVSLYVARNEIQRAADAAALVGAKAMADSGVTSVPPGDPNASAAMLMASSMANSAIHSLVDSAGFNQVAGGPVSLDNGTPTITYFPTGTNLTNNPTITVTLKRTGLPIFFARIIGGSASTTSATAVAEAYNPANVQSFTPVAPRCVKPWLVANEDPISGSNFVVDLGTGQVENLAVGETFFLNADCDPTNPLGCSFHNHGGSPQAFPSLHMVEFLPALIQGPNLTMFPTACNESDYEKSIAGCDVTPYQYLQCGGTLAPKVSWDPAIDPNPKFGGKNSPTAVATRCLINASADEQDQGQDSMDPPYTPWANPPQIKSGSGPKDGLPISTSNSVVTIPIVDSTHGDITQPPYMVTVIGFLQAFINYVHDDGNTDTHDEISITVLNLVGCSASANASPAIIGGNGASAIPVRLISPQ